MVLEDADLDGAVASVAVGKFLHQGQICMIANRVIVVNAIFARAMQVGMAHVNDHPVNDLPNNPFGGEKNSGIGRFGGAWAVDAFTTDQWVTVQHERRPLPF